MNKADIADREAKLLAALNAPSELDFVTPEQLKQAADAGEIPLEVMRKRLEQIRIQQEWIRDGLVVIQILGKRVPQCPCKQFFITTRKEQVYCPPCSKKRSQRTWRDNVVSSTGRPYQQRREPAPIRKVRTLLNTREDNPNRRRTKAEIRALAAEAGISEASCKAALQIISEEEKGPSQ